MIDRFLHIIGYRHADWRSYPPVMKRWRNGRWEYRAPNDAEARQMAEWQAFQA